MGSFYIVCNRYSGDNFIRFWKQDKCGYTFDLDKAGRFRATEPYLPILVPNEIERLPMYKDFLIHRDHIHILGDSIRAIPR